MRTGLAVFLSMNHLWSLRDSHAHGACGTHVAYGTHGMHGPCGAYGSHGAHGMRTDSVVAQRVYGYNPTYEGHTVRKDAADDKTQVEDP